MIEFLRQRAFIDFLKESTFAVNDVIKKSWGITKRHYLSIATLCFLMFITSLASTVMSYLFREVDFFLSIFMLVAFVVLYFTVNLTLFRYIFHLLDNEQADIQIVETIPTKFQIISFLIASLAFIVILLLIMIITAFLPFTIFYLLLKLKILTVDQQAFNLVSNIFVLIGFLSAFIAFVRLSFFPFFIIDKKTFKLKFSEIDYSNNTGSSLDRIFSVTLSLFKQAFASIKFSLVLTKGNFTKLALLLAVLGTIGYLYGYLTNSEILIPGKIYLIILVILFASFIIVPLTVVALTVAYRKMMDEYDGDEHPDIIHNIV